MNIRQVFLATMAFVTFGVGSVFGQITWDGTGNWVTDVGNWSPNSPVSSDDIVLSSGTVTLDEPVDDYGTLNMIDATLNVTGAGSATFTGTSNLGVVGGAGANVINIDSGSLEFTGTTNFAREGGSNTMELNVSGTGSFTTNGPYTDSWWGTPVLISVKGPDAQVTMGGEYYVGTVATVHAIVTHATDHTAINVPNLLSIQGGAATLKLTLDGVAPSLGDRWTIFDYAATDGGTFAILDGTSLTGGVGFTVDYNSTGTINANAVDVVVTNTLDVLVDTATGAVTLGNPVGGGVPYDIEGYTITSESGSLIAGSFTGIGEAGWVAAGGAQGPNFINETNFTGSTVVSTGNTFSLGNIFGGSLVGNGNGDNIVDGLDYLLWASNFGDDPADDPPGSPGNGDYNDDGKVDGLDYLAWASNFGEVASSAGTQDLVFNFLTTSGDILGGTATYFSSSVAVPEPSTFVLAGLALVGLLTARRRS